ncbi:MAG: putative amino-acid acetyltransferase [Deltaproteobacteria bacterium]|nr:putative amino-acid acetyltransferase [Deltaproteobacteria bacterium]
MKIRVQSQPVHVPGFRFAGVHCGLKQSGARDVALICSDVPAAAAAAFTTNRVKAAPVLVGLERLPKGRLQAIVINSGNANAYTGDDGLAVARAMCATVGHALRIDPELIIPSSTGRIGVPMPRARIARGIRAACAALSPGGFHEALEGIMTTDAFPKYATATLAIGGQRVTLAGMAKGAGMIAPRMALVGGPKGAVPAGHATMLAYFLTDAAASAPALRRALALALPQSFNAAIVDGDTSTNDTVVLMANGLAQNPRLTPGARAFPAFAHAVAAMMTRLARMVVKDGEGATKVIDIVVRGARTARDAARVADTIARSPLCKAAFFGGDPYAGRVVCAAGYSGATFDPGQLDVYLDDVQVVRRGREIVGQVERRAAAVTRRAEFTLTLDLHAGHGEAFRMAADLTVDYVRFNSAYRT